MSAPSGTCQRNGCGLEIAGKCAYVDHRSRACDTYWCQKHIYAAYGASFCARHASTMNAIGDEGVERGLYPELDNRTPSLVWWVGRDMDEDMTRLLTTFTGGAPELSVISDQVMLVTGGGRIKERRWERTWKIISHGGIHKRVAILVRELDPTVVVLRVEQKNVAETIPPWIANRPAGPPLDPDEEFVNRRIFYRELHNATAEALSSDGPEYKLPAITDSIKPWRPPSQ